MPGCYNEVGGSFQLCSLRHPLQEEGSVDMVNKTLPQPKASNAAAPTAPQNATAGLVCACTL
eukprot:2657412-Amphidinium_carterae.2